MRWLLLLLILFVTPLVHAEEGHMTLLTVTRNQESGGTADLYLSLKPGSGRVFIDSFPLSRLDTQSSTRYANQVACSMVDGCDLYDFFYTIRSGSQIVGGPSAGAAIAALTVAVLNGDDVRQDVAMTGTINSGGIIGPVGGVEHGIGTVIIPKLTLVNETNMSGNIVKVSTLEEALTVLTGVQYHQDLPPVREPPAYTERMREVADQICSRTAVLRAKVEERFLTYNDSNNYTRRIAVLPEERAYTRASLCFSSNIELSSLIVGDMTAEEVGELSDELRASVYELDGQLRMMNITTITDLEVYNIVRERVREVDEILSEANLSDTRKIAYAQERFVSAKSWSRFFGMPGKRVLLDETFLKAACLQKIAEAEERVNYVRLYSAALAGPSMRTLEDANELRSSEPVLCIFTASQAKAQANLVASTLFLSTEDIPELLREKLAADDLVLRKEVRKGYFPLMAYSYVRYAEDLAGHQPVSGLLFAEYGLELSNLDMYFEEEGRVYATRLSDGVWLFLLGALFGSAVALLITRKRP